MNNDQKLLDILSKKIRDAIDKEIFDTMLSIPSPISSPICRIELDEISWKWYVTIWSPGEPMRSFDFNTEEEAKEFAMVEKLKQS